MCTCKYLLKKRRSNFSWFPSAPRKAECPFPAVQAFRWFGVETGAPRGPAPTQGMRGLVDCLFSPAPTCGPWFRPLQACIPVAISDCWAPCTPLTPAAGAYSCAQVEGATIGLLGSYPRPPRRLVCSGSHRGGAALAWQFCGLSAFPPLGSDQQKRC